MKIDLRGPNGNVFYIMAKVDNVMTEQGKSKMEIKEALADMRSSDYEHALLVANRVTGNAFQFVR